MFGWLKRALGGKDKDTQQQTTSQTGGGAAQAQGNSLDSQEASLAPEKKGMGGALVSQEQNLEPSQTPQDGSGVAEGTQSPENAAGPDTGLAANELLLVPRASYSTKDLQGILSHKLSLYGMPSGAQDIQEFQREGAQAWKLVWNSTWGPQNGATHTNENFLCVEAASALTRMHALKGWSLVDASTQNQLNALIGGAENVVSKHARDQFFKRFSSFEAQTAENQATALQSLVGDKSMSPYLASEEVTTEATPGTLTKVRSEPKYMFQGKHEHPADIYEASFVDSTKVEIISPTSPQDANIYYHSVQDAFESLQQLMTKARASVKRVVLNHERNDGDTYWAAQFGQPDFRAYMTASVTGEVNFFPQSYAMHKNSLLGSMQHEAGHTLSFQDWGHDVNNPQWQAWKAAGEKDGIAVSQYGMNNLHEDYAETARVFQSSYGTPRWQEYSRMIPNRWAILNNSNK